MQSALPSEAQERLENQRGNTACSTSTCAVAVL
jgi:hypothetical protein